MTHPHPRDELGAAAWRGTRLGVLGVRRPAREARASGDAVSIANARHAVNHAWTFALAVCAILILTPLVAAVTRWVVGGSPEASATFWPVVLIGIVGLWVNSIAHGSRGARAAERGEIYRVPQTIPFTR